MSLNAAAALGLLLALNAPSRRAAVCLKICALEG
jgi:hypothetical protein